MTQIDCLDRDLEMTLEEAKAARANAKLAQSEAKTARSEGSSSSSRESLQACEEVEKLRVELAVSRVDSSRLSEELAMEKGATRMMLEAGKVFRGETRVAKEHLSISAMKLSSVHRSFDTCDAAVRYFPA